MRILGLLVAVVAIYVALNWRHFKQRLQAWARHTPVDPLALHQERINLAAENLRHAKDGLDRCRMLISSLQRQVDEGQRDVARLDVRIRSALTEGKEDRAAEYAEQIQSARAALEENSRQLAINKEAYASFVKQVQAAQDKIMAAKRDAESLESQLQTGHAESELAEITAGLATDPNLEGAKAEREAVRGEADTMKAKVQVARDLSDDQHKEIDENERARKMQAEALLAEYKAKMEQKPAGDAAAGQ